MGNCGSSGPASPAKGEGEGRGKGEGKDVLNTFLRDQTIHAQGDTPTRPNGGVVVGGPAARAAALRHRNGGAPHPPANPHTALGLRLLETYKGHGPPANATMAVPHVGRSGTLQRTPSTIGGGGQAAGGRRPAGGGGGGNAVGSFLAAHT